MNHLGLDIHQKHIQVQHMDSDGALGLSCKIATCATTLQAVLDELEAPLSVTLEAGRNHWWISQLLSSHDKVECVQVVDARRSRNLATELSVQKGYGRAKNDRIDAEMLGEADRLGLSPTIYLPTVPQLEMRTLCRHRSQLVLERSRSSVRIQSILSMYGVRSATKALLEDAELSPLANLPDYVSFHVKQFLDQHRFFHQQIQTTEKRLDKLMPRTDHNIKLLLTIPGVGIITARTLITEIFSISYFNSPRHLSSYSGLAPIEHDSDGKKGVIKLNRNCNYHLKNAFVTAAHTARTHPKYKAKYDRDVKKYGKIRAKLNLARKITKAVFWMLTRQQTFQ